LDKGSQKSISKFWEVLRPMNDSTKITGIGVSSSNNNTRTSDQLLIQCGGHGNLQQIITMLERITHLDQFKEHFTDWKQPWYFARSDDTHKLLQEIGYVNTTVYSSSKHVLLPNHQIYSKFIK
jgi:hypothetical protein